MSFCRSESVKEGERLSAQETSDATNDVADERLPVFDWIRAVAIVIIIFHHLPNYTFNFYDLRNFGIPLDFSIVNKLSGYLGLSLFIFMSGFLLNARKVYFSTWKEVRTFAKRKLIRILPLYYIALVTFSFTEDVRSPLKILIHALGLQLIFRTQTHSIPIRTLWFVGLITVYYFVFAIIKSSSLNRRARVYILILSWAIPLFLHKYFGLTDYRISLYWAIFWFGVLCSEKRLPRLKVWKYLSFVSAALFVAIFVWIDVDFGPLIGSGSTFFPKYLLLNVFMLAFVVSAYNVCDWLAQRLGLQPGMRFIAYISYCVYLFHRPVWYIMRELLVNQFSVNNPYLILTILTVAGLPLMIALSYGLQVAYDRYFRQHLLTAFKLN